MEIMKKTVIFLTGGAGYVAMELLWRGRSHKTMFLAGGLSLLLVGHQEEMEPRLPLVLRILTGAGIITMVELGIGLLANRDFSVWDYRDVPGNYLGQICLPFCLAWIPVSFLAGRLYCWLDRMLTR